RHYGSATLAVTRAGAGTLAELACAGLPAILLPYPQAVDQHQLANARIFEQAGAAVIVEHAAESTVTAERLDKALQSLILDLGRQQTMRAAMRRLARPDAARRVADVLLAYVHPKVS
ncbi:MAG: hypothetical protein JSS02_21750, partial [Planctomycetes bacterium]|nr:hypothetical protein [Planctomycetota bacterium]